MCGFIVHSYSSVHPGAIKTIMIQATLDHSDDIDAAKPNFDMAQRTGVTADYVANCIIKAIKANKIRIRVGKDALLLDLLKRWFPVGIPKMLKGIA